MPAFFMHGVPDTAAMWDRVRGHLQRDDVVCHSMPGFGAPLPAGWEPTKEAYTDWWIERLAEVGEPVDLVGHDWGSLLAQRVASLRPDLVRTLAFGAGPVDSTYTWHEMAKMWQTPGVGEEIMAGVTPEGLRDGLVGQIDEAAAAQVALHVDDTMKHCILGLYRSAVNVGSEWQPGVEAVAGRFPALVLWGHDDPFVAPEFGERAAARLDARLLMFDDSGHWWPVTKPSETAAALEQLWR